MTSMTRTIEGLFIRADGHWTRAFLVAWTLTVGAEVWILTRLLG